jgi:hypothetical protein
MRALSEPIKLSGFGEAFARGAQVFRPSQMDAAISPSRFGPDERGLSELINEKEGT